MAEGQKKRLFRGEEFFRRVLAERGEGVSLYELAHRHGVAGSVLCRWAQKLEGRRATEGGGESAAPRRAASRRPQAPALVPVTVVAARPSMSKESPPPGFVVELRCGRAVRVPPRFSGEELVRLIAVVEAASC